MKTTMLIIGLAAAIVLSSCKTVDFGYVKKSEIEGKITAMKADFQTKLEESNRSIIAAKDAVIQRKDEQLQAVADALYGGSVVFKSIIEPTRTDLILINLNEEAWSAIGHILPSYDKMLEINARIAKELDATKTSLADLKRTHDAIVAQNTKLSDETKAALDRATKAEGEKTALITAHSAELSKAQDELAAANNTIIANEQKRANDAAARHATYTKISLSCGALAAACLIGVFWSPFGKEKFAVMAAVFGFAAVGIWYVTPLLVIGVGGGCALIVAGWFVWSHRNSAKALETEKTVATDVYRALQRVKEKAGDVWDKVVKPELEEAHLKYQTAPDGTVTKVPDPERTAFIDRRLAEVGDK